MKLSKRFEKFFQDMGDSKSNVNRKYNWKDILDETGIVVDNDNDPFIEFYNCMINPFYFLSKMDIVEDDDFEINATGFLSVKFLDALDPRQSGNVLAQIPYNHNLKNLIYGYILYLILMKKETVILYTDHFTDTLAEIDKFQRRLPDYIPNEDLFQESDRAKIINGYYVEHETLAEPQDKIKHVFYLDYSAGQYNVDLDVSNDKRVFMFNTDNYIEVFKLHIANKKFPCKYVGLDYMELGDKPSDLIERLKKGPVEEVVNKYLMQYNPIPEFDPNKKISEANIADWILTQMDNKLGENKVEFFLGKDLKDIREFTVKLEPGLVTIDNGRESVSLFLINVDSNPMFNKILYSKFALDGIEMHITNTIKEYIIAKVLYSKYGVLDNLKITAYEDFKKMMDLEDDELGKFLYQGLVNSEIIKMMKYFKAGCDNLSFYKSLVSVMSCDRDSFVNFSYYTRSFEIVFIVNGEEKSVEIKYDELIDPTKFVNQQSLVEKFSNELDFVNAGEYKDFLNEIISEENYRIKELTPKDDNDVEKISHKIYQENPLMIEFEVELVNGLKFPLPLNRYMTIGCELKELFATIAPMWASIYEYIIKHYKGRDVEATSISIQSITGNSEKIEQYKIVISIKEDEEDPIGHILRVPYSDSIRRYIHDFEKEILDIIDNYLKEN